MKKEKAITLIALVITIIILLILAGISIATLTGQNGLLSKANVSGEETKKANYKEVLELLGQEIRPEKALENLSTKEFMDRYQEKIEKEIKEGNNLKGATVNRKNDETIYVTTKEGWIYKITEDKVEFLGKKGENPAPDLQESDIELELNPEGYTKGNVKVKIIVTNSELTKYSLQYSKDAQNWSNYTGEFEVSENGPIYTRLMNELEEVGASATKTISNIDREKPNEAEVTFSPTSTDTDNSIIATVAQSDSGSGVAITSCKWDYRKSDQEIGENEADYKGGTFKSNPEPITLQTYIAGTYYLHVLTVNNAGNKKETIKGPIEVAQGSYQEIFSDIYTKTETYTDENGKTARIPEGFAVGVTPGINKVDDGLVITDQIDANHRSTGNEFVWVPVPIKANFKSIDGYGMNQGGQQAVVKVGDIAEPCQNATQDAIDDYTAMCDNVTSEKNKGFYMGRYETGKESNQAVVKKNKTVYNNIMWGESFTDFSGGAIEKGKEFVKTTYTNKGKKVGVTSSLVYGIQWDATMQFFDNNYINGDCATNSYVRCAGNNGNFSGRLKPTGSSDNYKMKNIYDMAGNYFEWTLESCHYAYGEHNPVHRGGDAMSNNNIFGASYRQYNTGRSVRSQSCWIPYCPLFGRLKNVSVRLILYLK